SQRADLVFEGMTIAGYAIGAEYGIVYLRGEYEYMLEDLKRILEERRKKGLLGQNILGKKGFNFAIRIQIGAGAYICGEESALIESLEGKRGAPRER
ncbi:NADP oxidoreductase, partial [Clostridium perfringens]|nr:NADP oxidoreductase [Clostridium perfringens]